MDEDDVFKDPEIVGKTLAEHYLRHAFIRMKTRLHEVSEPVLWELGTIYEGVDDDRKPEAFAAMLRHLDAAGIKYNKQQFGAEE